MPCQSSLWHTLVDPYDMRGRVVQRVPSASNAQRRVGRSLEGLSLAKHCPSFINDFDCRRPENVPEVPKGFYARLAKQVSVS